MAATRRFVLGSFAAAGALVVGWSVLPPRQRVRASRPVAAAAWQTALNGWVSIGTDETVRLICPKSEMGQGVHTALAMLLAEELEVPLSAVQIQGSGIDAIYANIATLVDGLPFHPDDDGVVKRLAQWLTAKSMREMGVMMTGGSSSVKDLWLPLRQAGASAREMLLAAAAARWQVPVAECVAQAGVVKHASGKQASYGELVGAAAALPVPEAPVLKPASAFKLIGTPALRHEAAAKVNGTALYALDVKLPNMLYASVLACPTRGGSVVKVDEAAALKLPGVKKVVTLAPVRGASGAVAVVAEQRIQAIKALAALKVEWAAGPAAGFSSAGVYETLGKAIDTDDGFGYYKHGDVDAALKTAARTLNAEYRAPYVAHQQMEPNCCTVWAKDGAATVWAPTQVPDLARSGVAKQLGLDEEKVLMNVMLLGGGFGRRLEADFIVQAAAVAQAVAQSFAGTPVQTLWSREQDLKNDFFRPACVSRFTAGLDGKGQLVAWRNTSAGQAVLPQALGRALGLPWVGPDKTAAEGAFDQPYEWPAARVGHVMVDLPVPVGFWRSVGHSHQAFFKECFVDEVAGAAGVDPLTFRESLLQQPRHARHLAVLRRCAQAAGWGLPLADAEDGAKKARGLALHQSFGSVVAQVVEASLAPAGAGQRIRVHRVVCAIDCGLAVNPLNIQAQMESAVVFGLSAALYGEVHLVNGQVQESNFHDAPVLRVNECPAIETHIMASSEPPEGVGEPGVPPLAPALANALFALTGQRLRSLPLKI